MYFKLCRFFSHDVNMALKSSRKLCVKFKVMKDKKKVRDCKNNVLKEGKGASVKCLVLHFNGSKLEVKEEP